MEQKNALSEIASALKRKISGRDAAIFAVSFLLAVGIHLFAFSNKLINHDDLSEMFGGGSFLPSGRWLLNPVLKLTGRVSSPLINGAVGSVWLALTVTVVAKIFDMRSLPAIAAVAVCMVSFPTVACTWAYMFTAPAYFLAMFLSAAGVLLIRGRGWPRFAAGAGLITLSMGCYQAYFGFAAALAVTALLVDLCVGKKEMKGKPLFMAALRSLLGLAAGIAAYFVILRLCLWATGTELISYAGIDNMTNVTLAELLRRAAAAYRSFWDFPASRVFSGVHTHFPWIMRVGVLLSVLGMCAFAVKRGILRAPAALAMLLALIAVLPLAVDLVYVMAGEENVHWLMIYPNVVVWLLPAVLADKVELPASGRVRRSAAAGAALVLLAFSALHGYEGALITNKVYLEMELTGRGANAYLTRLIARVEEQEGYEPGAKVAMIGSARSDTSIPDESLTGVFVGDGLLNIYSRAMLMNYFQAFAGGVVSADEIEAIRASGVFGEMPCYPADGSVETIDGIIVVKLSD